MKVFTVWFSDLLAHNDDSGFDYKIAVIAKDMMDAVIKANDFLDKLKSKSIAALKKSGACKACLDSCDALEIDMVRFHADIVDGVGLRITGESQDEDIQGRKPSADDWIDSLVRRHNISHDGHD